MRVIVALVKLITYLEKPDRQLQREWMAVVKDACSSDWMTFFLPAERFSPLIARSHSILVDTLY